MVDAQNQKIGKTINNQYYKKNKIAGVQLHVL
jgi:hypothetical protein